MNSSGRKSGSVLLGLLIGLLLLVSMAYFAGDAVSAAPQGKPIVMGGTLPLTGMYAETGKWVERGYRYWEEEINKKGGLLGRPVKLIVYDDASSVEKGVNFLERAINVDKVDLLLGGYPGTTAAAQMAVAEKYRMLYNSMGGHGKSWEQGYTYSTCVPAIMGEWGMNGFFAIMESLPANISPKTAAVINMKSGIGESYHTGIIEGAKKSGIKLLMDEWYALPLPSADALVAKAAGTKADIFIVNGFFPDGVMVIRAMKALNYNPKAVYQTIGSTIPAWTKELGADGDYVFDGGNPVNASLPFPEAKKLCNYVKEKYQTDASLAMYFLLGYGWCEAVQKAVEGAKSLNQDVLRDYMHTHEITILGGLKHKLDKRGLPAPFQSAFQLQKGAVQVVYPPELVTAKAVYPKPPFSK